MRRSPGGDRKAPWCARRRIPPYEGFRACGRDQRAFRSPFGNLRGPSRWHRFRVPEQKSNFPLLLHPIPNRFQGAAKESRGFGAPGKRSSGSFSAENGRQPRTDRKAQFAIVVIYDDSVAHWASGRLPPPLVAPASAPWCARRRIPLPAEFRPSADQRVRAGPAAFRSHLDSSGAAALDTVAGYAKKKSA